VAWGVDIHQHKKADDMKPILIAASAALTLALTGCISVSDHSAKSAKVQENTDLAVSVCGGPGNVAEVNRDGYRCKTR
jgi:archaellum component FlaG (FlaF/FlaG flagellin family)